MADELKENGSGTRPLNILLVEDNEADVKIAIRAFSKARLKNNIYSVSDGREALDFVNRNGKYADKTKYPVPDLILLDIQMPKLDGFQVLEKIKGDIQFSHIPVIMLTSSKNEEDIAKSYKFGASSYIQKPVNYDSFVKVVESFNYYWHVINKLPGQDRQG